MSSYLQRLAARAAEGVGAPAVRPSLRSTSPIAELDSRVGAPGLDDGGLGIGSSTGGDVPGSPEASVEIAHTATPTIRRKPAAATAAASASPPQAPTTARPYLDSVLASPAQPSTSSRPPAPAPLADGPPEMAPTTTRLAGDEFVARPAVPSKIRSPDRLSVDEMTDTEAVTAPAMPSAGSDSAKPSTPRLATAPSKSRRDAGAPSKGGPGIERAPGGESVASGARASAAARPSEREIGAEIRRLLPPELAAAFPEPRPAHRRAVAPAAPRVVIGRIDVEVVPPTSPIAAAGSERPRPATAAAVSKIGPLEPAVRPNLLFGLRRS